MYKDGHLLSVNQSGSVNNSHDDKNIQLSSDQLAERKKRNIFGDALDSFFDNLDEFVQYMDDMWTICGESIRILRMRVDHVH